MAAPYNPPVTLMCQHRSCQPVGEDPHHMRPSEDLPEESFQRVVQSDLPPVRHRERGEGQDVRTGFGQHRGGLRVSGSSRIVSHRPVSGHVGGVRPSTGRPTELCKAVLRSWLAVRQSTRCLHSWPESNRAAASSHARSLPRCYRPGNDHKTWVRL